LSDIVERRVKSGLVPADGVGYGDLELLLAPCTFSCISGLRLFEALFTARATAQASRFKAANAPKIRKA
jgi:hypothetical protein